jgi:hypothetical protein
LADPVLIPEPDPPPASTTGASRPGEPTTTAQKQVIPSRPAAIPNSRKGYKLTLWVSATSEDGVADAHGLLQLDGADPIPFCQVRGVQNPLARALQEAFLAIQRVRAKPPRMSAPATGAGTPTRPYAGPTRAIQAPAPTTPASPPRSPAPASIPAESAATSKRKPVGQPSLF